MVRPWHGPVKPWHGPVKPWRGPVKPWHGPVKPWRGPGRWITNGTLDGVSTGDFFLVYARIDPEPVRAAIML